MGLWTKVKIEVRYPKDQNISIIVKEVLDKYSYPETFFSSFYSKENGVLIDLRSTFDAKLMMPLLLDIRKKIKSHSYFQIETYLL